MFMIAFGIHCTFFIALLIWLKPNFGYLAQFIFRLKHKIMPIKSVSKIRGLFSDKFWW